MLKEIQIKWSKVVQKLSTECLTGLMCVAHQIEHWIIIIKVILHIIIIVRFVISPVTYLFIFAEVQF